jgi:hypothetical protein
MQTGPVGYGCINVGTAGSHTLAGAVSGRKIRLLGLVLYAAGAVTVTIEHSDGTPFIGPVTFASAGGVVLPVDRLGYGESGVGKGLHLLLSDDVQIGGCVTYQEAK